MTPTLAHGSFTLRRSWAAPPARVYAAWADLALKAQWFAPPGWVATRRELDLREGGEEWEEGRFPSGLTTSFHARYHLVEPSRRLVFDYDLRLNDAFHSVTLASLLLIPEGEGTALRYSEQVAYLDGEDGTGHRQEGTEAHFAAIARLLGVSSAGA